MGVGKITPLGTYSSIVHLNRRGSLGVRRTSESSVDTPTDLDRQSSPTDTEDLKKKKVNREAQIVSRRNTPEHDFDPCSVRCNGHEQYWVRDARTQISLQPPFDFAQPFSKGKKKTRIVSPCDNT